MKTYKYPSVLTIAGFDGSGGAGSKQISKLFQPWAVMPHPY